MVIVFLHIRNRVCGKGNWCTLNLLAPRPEDYGSSAMALYYPLVQQVMIVSVSIIQMLVVVSVPPKDGWESYSSECGQHTVPKLTY